jgi:2,4-dienoyl-CoA reductase-like NADH-dependent reductase (Old Yellow Enzyme family)/thioredoxin reductase
MAKPRMLFEPFQIKSMELKNRIGMAPLLNMPGVWTSFSITDETIAWFEARARGGAGLIMTGTFAPPMFAIPGLKEGFSALAEVIHSHGARLGVQIGSGGPMLGSGPSLPPYPTELDAKQAIMDLLKMDGGLLSAPAEPHALSVEEIEGHVQAFADTAATLKEAGVDCVELHCAHGGATLCCSFISPYYNRREDQYGGSWENRLRFPTDALKRMREAVGEDYPLLVRISADELLGDKGITIDDTTRYIVPALEEAGADCIDVSQGSITHSPEGIEIPLYYPRGCFIHLAEAVKKVTRLPVIGVGRIVELEMAEDFLQEGKADLIYLGRQLTADPDTPRKYQEGRPEDVRKCVACVEGCGTPCSINYEMTPGVTAPTPAETPRRVLVIGGGVAGMEAARVAAQRGHRVTLIEKRSELGGMVAALALEPLTAEFANLIEYLRVQIQKLGVDLRLSTEAGLAEIDALNPDVVVMATGSSMIIPEVARGKPGLMDHIEALRRRSEIGHRVVVWGMTYGAELAISLAEEGREVVLIGEGGEKTLGGHASNFRRWWILRKLADVNTARGTPEAQRISNPKVLSNVRVEAITSEGIELKDESGGKEVLAYDTLVVSRGRERDNALTEQLGTAAAEVHEIGDCSSVGDIHKAISSANEVARAI